MFAAVSAVVLGIGILAGAFAVSEGGHDQKQVSSGQQAVVTVEHVQPRR